MESIFDKFDKVKDLHNPINVMDVEESSIQDNKYRRELNLVVREVNRDSKNYNEEKFKLNEDVFKFVFTEAEDTYKTINKLKEDISFLKRELRKTEIDLEDPSLNVTQIKESIALYGEEIFSKTKERDELIRNYKVKDDKEFSFKEETKIEKGEKLNLDEQNIYELEELEKDLVEDTVVSYENNPNENLMLCLFYEEANKILKTIRMKKSISKTPKMIQRIRNKVSFLKSNDNFRASFLTRYAGEMKEARKYLNKTKKLKALNKIDEDLGMSIELNNIELQKYEFSKDDTDKLEMMKKYINSLNKLKDEISACKKKLEN